jgi:uncharacterized protein with PQ loop repeat
MPPHIIDFFGWLPAIIFPAGTLIQLITMVRTKNRQGVSCLTWTLFGIANIGLYVYTEKYLELQAIVGFLGTAILDFIIVGLALSRRG